ncbi:MAG: nucleotide exchange factor GrpE [Opitutaceae bacterium]|nr:nucleotide exchange factor GrpE [Opitutaceae bacterium]|tara:strand:+ start:3640 stop:4275 length:636 start_codon:yes stop_codon:yes gene_type:complete
MKSSESTESNETQEAAAENEAVQSQTAAEATENATEEKAEKDEKPLTPEEQLAAAKEESKSHYERYLRAAADHENFRKRTIREKDELRQYAASRVLEDLLPVLDNLSLGMAAASQPNADVKTIVEGIGMVQTQLKTALDQQGLKEINPAGETFDAHQHDALSQQASDDVAEGDVLNVIRVGYSLNGRLLRPASVVVSSGVANEEEAEEAKD